jgi:type IV pilus assembly protein PilQ
VVISTEILQAVRSLIVSRKGKVIADGRSNSIVVSDAASNMEKIGKLIRELDVPIPQVLIEARLIQVDKKRLESIGILWTAERATPANPTAIGGPSSINTEIGGFNLDAKLDVLQQKGDIQLLLNPRITTLHDRASIVSSVDSYNFKQKTTRTSPLIGEQVIETISAVNVPVELVVRPHVNPDNTVQMEVWITMTAITDMNIGKDIPPNTAQQTARTRLIIRNRETGVIGGLLRDSVDTKENKVPVLGDLPWWLGGGFFRNTRQEKKKTELVLFLTPTIEEGI